PRAGRAKAAAPVRSKPPAAPRPTDGEREMDTPYPQTRRGSARPSPRGGAPDERRGALDRQRPGRGAVEDRPKRPGGKPARGGTRGGPPQGRDREEGAPTRRPVSRD